jgi:hypothetical protein
MPRKTLPPALYDPARHERLTPPAFEPTVAALLERNRVRTRTWDEDVPSLLMGDVGILLLQWQEAPSRAIADAIFGAVPAGLPVGRRRISDARRVLALACTFATLVTARRHAHGREGAHLRYDSDYGISDR